MYFSFTKRCAGKGAKDGTGLHNFQFLQGLRLPSFCFTILVHTFPYSRSPHCSRWLLDSSQHICVAGQKNEERQKAKSAPFHHPSQVSLTGFKQPYTSSARIESRGHHPACMEVWKTMPCLLGGPVSSCSWGSPGEAMGSVSHKPFHTNLRKADVALRLESLLKDAEQRMTWSYLGFKVTMGLSGVSMRAESRLAMLISWNASPAQCLDVSKHSIIVLWMNEWMAKLEARRMKQL